MKQTSYVSPRALLAALTASLLVPLGAAAQSVATIHSFTGAAAGGRYPVAPPVFDGATATLLGVTTRSGDNASVPGENARALVYSVTSSGTGFASALTSVINPNSTVVRSSGGTFYFGVEDSGSANRLLSFTSSTLAPTQVWGGSLVTHGLMGLRGGLSITSSGDVLFPVSRSNSSRLMQFSGGGASQIHAWASYATTSTDVHTPAASIVASNGYVYGVADNHPSSLVASQAIVYRILPGGTGYQQLKVFDNASGYPVSARSIAGTNPFAHAVFSGLVEGGDGWLYGTTFRAGADLNSLPVDTKGKLYRIARDPDGSGNHAFQVLHSFAGGTGDGEAAHGPLVSVGGTVYGTTLRGGASGQGVLFAVTTGTTPVYSVVHNFAAATTGSAPVGVAAGEAGYLYGATYDGGANGQGTVFRVTLPASRTAAAATPEDGANDDLATPWGAAAARP